MAAFPVDVMVSMPWVERPTGVQTNHSFSMASTLGICQIPVSRLWPFPHCWPLAQSPRVKPECKAGLPGIHGLPLSPVHPGSLNIPFWQVSKLQARRQNWSLFLKTEAEVTFGWILKEQERPGSQTWVEAPVPGWVPDFLDQCGPASPQIGQCPGSRTVGGGF